MSKAQNPKERATVLRAFAEWDGESPAYKQAVMKFAGSQLYIKTKLPPERVSRSSEKYIKWEADVIKSTENLQGIPVENERKAFDYYWVEVLGYKKNSEEYRRRIRRLK